MKIFISWSGERSHRVAELLDSWIQCVIQAVEPWFSSKDIDRGSLWFSDITEQLAHINNGIICLTKSNKDKPWILFEAGALAKGMNSNKIFTFLIDLKPSDIRDPLAQFNHTEPNKKSIHNLLKSINNGLEEKALPESILANVFKTYWPQFESGFNKIINETPNEDINIERPEGDLMNEILYSVRNIEKRLRNIENIDTLSLDSEILNSTIAGDSMKLTSIDNIHKIIKISNEYKNNDSYSKKNVYDALSRILPTKSLVHKYYNEIIYPKTQ